MPLAVYKTDAGAVYSARPQAQSGLPPAGTAGHDTRRLQDYLGHRSISSTVRYTELDAGKFRDFWRE
jgi:hypothetical protein